MRSLRNSAGLRFVGALFLVLAIAALAVLSKPEWLEYFAEAGAFLGVVVVVQIIADETRRQFRSELASPFERALRRDFYSQKPPSQLLTAISMVASPEKSTFDLLAATADGRLRDRYGFGLNDEKARDILGPETYDLLLLERGSGRSWAVRKRGWQARAQSIARFPGRSVAGSREAPESLRSVYIEQARKILTSLEQL